MARRSIDWAALGADPRFQELHRRKATFLSLLMAVSILYYFMLPVGAALFPDFFRIKVLGVVNVGLLFAFSEFLLAWGIAALYTRRANREFDQMAEALNRDIMARSLQAQRR